MNGPPLRIAVIGPARFPLVEPFPGGLEAHTHTLAMGLRRRGHAVTVFAAPGSDPALDAVPLDLSAFTSSTAARADLAAPPERWMAEHHAYLALMQDLARERRFDVVHDNSLHHLPVALAGLLDVPVVTTLHTPPVPWLESAALLARPGHRWVAVSEAMARAWSHVVACGVVPNAVDTDLWVAGPGGPRALWSGRLVPEKAPHEAALAALAGGVPLDLCGPVHDHQYFEQRVRPLLGHGVRYLGHVPQRTLRRLAARARVAVVTPAWDEPFGLVAAEAMACGTPVVGYARGGLPEVVGNQVGALVTPGDVGALAAAMVLTDVGPAARARARSRAVERFSLGAMLSSYEAVYRASAGRDLVA